MPSELKTLIALRGTEQYARFLAKFARKVGREDLTEMAEIAIARWASEHGMIAPRRAGPKGRPKKTG